MKLSSAEIKRLNITKTAKKGRSYSDYEGNKYTGQADGTLLAENKSNKTRIFEQDTTTRISTNEKDIDALEKDIKLKEYTTTVDAKLKDLECKLIAMNIVLG